MPVTSGRGFVAKRSRRVMERSFAMRWAAHADRTGSVAKFLRTGLPVSTELEFVSDTRARFAPDPVAVNKPAGSSGGRPLRRGFIVFRWCDKNEGDEPESRRTPLLQVKSLILERTTGFEPATPNLARFLGASSRTCDDATIGPYAGRLRSYATPSFRVVSRSLTGPRRDPQQEGLQRRLPSGVQERIQPQ
jgi:hypothetical protein